MSFISYAQNFEDVMLWRALGQIEHGFYIDIGAQDPIIDSVSLAFHEHGWRGIHVEPTPHYAESLKQQRPGDTVIQAAVGKGQSKLRLFEIPDTGISTADPIIAQQHRERGFDVHEINVSCITLSAVFKACVESEIHWLKIDVEGFEQQVLSSWGKSAARPWIVVVESTLPLTQIETHESWEAILIGYGYTPVYFDGLNRYYLSDAHPELKDAFRAPPNVFDDFTLNGTASAAFHQLIDARYKEKISAILAQNEQQKQSATNEIERLTLSLASLDKTHAEQEQKLAQREQEVAAQLLAIRQQAAQEMAEQARSHSEQELALQREHTEREQTLAQQLQAGQEELRRLEQERTRREIGHAEQINEARQTLENQLRTQAQREQDIASQMLAMQQQAAQEKSELARSYSEQERALLQQHAEREQALSQQLQDSQQKLHHLEQERTRREIGHAEQINEARQTLENQLRTQAQREQEIAAQLLNIQQQATQEMAELARSHIQQERTLVNQHAAHEQAFKQQLQAGQQELRRIEQDRAQREQVLSKQNDQTNQKVENLLRSLIQREQEVATRLLAIQQQAAQERAELVRSYGEQERALLQQHAEREQILSQQLQASQQKLHHWDQARAQHELEHAKQLQTLTNQLQIAQQKIILLEDESELRQKALDQEISNLKNEAQALQHARQLQEQQHGFEIQKKQDEQNHLIQLASAFQTKLIDQIKAEHQTSLQLSLTLVDVLQSTAKTHAPFTWPLTSPIRAAALILSPKKKQSTATTALLNGELSRETGYDTIMGMPSPPIATTLEGLLSYSAPLFIRAAYQMILGREPDPEGLSYYLGRLRADFSKLHILMELRTSQEGRERLVNLPGLDKSIQRYIRGQYPVVGWLFRLLNGAEANHATAGKLRAIEQQIFLFDNESHLRFKQMEAALASLPNLVMQPTQPSEGTITETPKNTLTDETIGPPLATAAPAEPDELKRLSVSARKIYFQLKRAASIHADRAA